jgi:hypothetical protein
VIFIGRTPEIFTPFEDGSCGDACARLRVLFRASRSQVDTPAWQV